MNDDEELRGSETLTMSFFAILQWDRFEMRVYKRVIDLHSPSETVKQITSVSTYLLVVCCRHMPPCTQSSKFYSTTL
jgi:hypothetical protein